MGRYCLINIRLFYQDKSISKLIRQLVFVFANEYQTGEEEIVAIIINMAVVNDGRNSRNSFSIGTTCSIFAQQFRLTFRYYSK